MRQLPQSYSNIRRLGIMNINRRQALKTGLLAVAAMNVSGSIDNVRAAESGLFKFSFLLSKRDGMTTEEFQRWWRDVHAPIVKRLPGLKRYVLNMTVQSQDKPAAWDGIAELWFERSEELQAAFQTSTGMEAKNDAPNFLNVDKTLMVISREVIVV
jgi:uncharacterized protein (TIGR02118 family)